MGRYKVLLWLVAFISLGNTAFIAPARALLVNPGEILLADSGPPTRLIRIDPATGAMSVLASGGFLRRLNDLTVDAVGDILLLDQVANTTGAVIKVDACTGAQTVVSSYQSFARPFGIALEGDGHILVGDPGLNSNTLVDGKLIRIDPLTGEQSVISSGAAFRDPQGVAVAPDGASYVLVADVNAAGGPGAIFRVDPVTGAQTVVASGAPFSTPRDVAIDSDGTLLVADLNAPTTAGGIFRVNPADGSKTVVSSGQLFFDPSGLWIQPDGKILVADVGPFGSTSTGRVIRVDPQLPYYANQSLVAEGFPIVDPADLMLYPDVRAAIAGTVTGSCNGTTQGLLGVTVDLFGTDELGEDVLLASVATDGSGSYSFGNLVPEEYTVHLVTPLGFQSLQSSAALSFCKGTTAVVPFESACLSIAAQPRSMGYWKHQVNAHLTGIGHAQESLSDLLHDIDLLVQRFNENIVNPVIVYVPAEGDPLAQLRQLLTLNRGATMGDRARQQILALLLNVVSQKISQTQVISADGATVSQAVTYCNDLIQDADAVNDETAKDLAEWVNTGVEVPAGMIPTSTRVIAYGLRPAGEPMLTFAMEPVRPNPAAGPFHVSFSLPGSGSARLEVFDVAGRRLLSQEVGELGPGRHEVELGASRSLAGGVYLVRLTRGGQALSQRIAVIQ